MAQVMKILKKGMHHDTDDATKDEIRQIYSNAAQNYHKYRPKYPESIINKAIEESPLLNQKKKQSSECKILEIGCGPGTLTLPLALRGYQIVAFDPSFEMIQKAKEVCNHLPNVKFQQVPFTNFSTIEDNDDNSNDNGDGIDNDSSHKFDAVVAATSLHWALAEGNRFALIQKLESLLHDDGTLILLWNYPNMPTSMSLRNKIADALDEPKPYSFGVKSIDTLHKGMIDHVHSPILESGLFQPFSTHEMELDETLSITSFVHLLTTISTYISMEPSKQNHVLQTIEDVMRQECDGGEFVETHRKLILNVTKKCKKTY